VLRGRRRPARRVRDPVLQQRRDLPAIAPAGSFLFRMVMQDSGGELRSSRWLLIITAGANAFPKRTALSLAIGTDSSSHTLLPPSFLPHTTSNNTQRTRYSPRHPRSLHTGYFVGLVRTGHRSESGGDSVRQRPSPCFCYAFCFPDAIFNDDRRSARVIRQPRWG
jgi:hypothetical protein